MESTDLRAYFDAHVVRLNNEGELLAVAELTAAKLTRAYADAEAIPTVIREQAFADYPRIPPRPEPEYDDQDEITNKRDLEQWTADLSSSWSHKRTHRYFVRETVCAPVVVGSLEANRANFPIMAAYIDAVRSAFGLDCGVTVVYAFEGGKSVGKPPTTRTHRIFTEVKPNADLPLLPSAKRSRRRSKQPTIYR